MSEPITIGLIIAIALILAVVLSLLFSSRSTAVRPQRGVADAFHLLLLGRRDEARTVLADAVQRGEATPEGYLRLGDLLRDDGDAMRALALHQGLLARPALSAEMRRLTEVSIADDLLALGRVAEAEERLAKLDARVHDVSLLERHARALHLLGRVDDAIDVLTRRAKLSAAAREDSARYVGEMAREALRRGNLETAVDRARRARKIDADLSTSYAVEGDALRQRGRTEDALRRWREGFEHGGNGREALLPRMVEAAFEAGRMEWMLEELESLRNERPHDVVLWRAVTSLRLRRGDLESFFALVESPPRPDAIDLDTSSAWLRHLGSMEDPGPFRRLLNHLPDSFGPSEWLCPACGAADGEPRDICVACGRLVDLMPARTPAQRRDAGLLVGGS